MTREQFWQRVYIAAIHAGETTPAARRKADEALQEMDIARENGTL